MKLHQLRALAAVSETGSIQEASRLLHVTQPALSKAIKELETSVGATLFVRTSKGVQLTAHGQRLVSHVRALPVRCDLRASQRAWPAGGDGRGATGPARRIVGSRHGHV